MIEVTKVNSSEAWVYDMYGTKMESVERRQGFRLWGVLDVCDAQTIQVNITSQTSGYETVSPLPRYCISLSGERGRHLR